MENFFLARWWKTNCLNKIIIFVVGGLTLFCFFGVALAMFGALFEETPAEEPVALVITPQVSPTLTQTIGPIENVKTLCLKIQSPSEPAQVKDLQNFVRGFLEPLGVKVHLSDTAECDADMVIDLKLRALGDSYLDDQTGKYRICYTGATAKGELVFRFSGASRHFEIDGKVPTGNYITKCPTSEEEAPFVSAWREEMFLAIYELWGIKVLPVAVGQHFISNEKFRDTVILLYEHEGPKAISTVPDLINELLKDDLIIGNTAWRALKIVSGEDFGEDPNAWKRWWSEQSVSPTQLTVVPQPQPVAATPSQLVVASPTQLVAVRPEGVILIANPECKKPLILSKDKVTVRVRWGAKTYELAESNADQMKIVLLLDGQDLGDVGSYRQPAELYSSAKEYRCGPSESIYWVQWDVPVGWMSPGVHTIAVDYILAESISDGFTTYPKGPISFLETTFEVAY
jgi:hypothetical protein